mgnify:CR=1 FL=1
MGALATNLLLWAQGEYTEQAKQLEPALQAELAQYTEHGYSHLLWCREHGFVGILPLLYTTAVVSELTGYGYGDRWCFDGNEKALTAALQWGPEHPEPQGWHRHPQSGRRIQKDGTVEVFF